MSDILTGKQILVTGATGFIGTHLVRRLRSIPDVRMALLSRSSQSYQFEGVKCIHSSLETITHDTWKQAGFDRFDVVFHLGAFTPKSGGTANDIAAIYRDNINGTRVLLDSLKQRPEKFIFSSSLDVYATSTDEAVLDENAPINPSTLYGASKLFCEQLVRTWAHQHDISVSILRYGHIFGPGEEAYQKLIPQIIRQLLHGEVPEIWGDGSVLRDFLYVEDAIEATLRSAEIRQPVVGPINIIRGKSTSVRSIVTFLIQFIGFNGEARYRLDYPSSPSLQFDNAQMRRVLGKWPLTSLERGLALEVDYFKHMYDIT